MFKFLLIMEIVLAVFSFCFGVVSSMFTLNKKRVPAFWTKMAASLCFLMIGFLNAFYSTDGVFAVGILAGLFYGFAGDAFLAAPSVLPGRPRLYQAGGVLCFAMGHVLYCAAMIGYYGMSSMPFHPLAAHRASTHRRSAQSAVSIPQGPIFCWAASSSGRRRQK